MPINLIYCTPFIGWIAYPNIPMLKSSIPNGQGVIRGATEFADMAFEQVIGVK